MTDLLPQGIPANEALDTKLETLLRDEFVPAYQKLIPPRDLRNIFQDKEHAEDRLKKELQRYTSLHDTLRGIKNHIEEYVGAGYTLEHDNPLHAAGRIPGHDLSNNFNPVLGWLDFYPILLADGKTISSEYISSGIDSLQQIRPYLNVMGTLATGDKEQFRYEMTPEEVDRFIKRVHYDKDFKIQGTMKGTLDSRYLVPVAQILKNAYKYGKDPRVEIDEDEWSTSIRVIDQGEGIKLPLDEIPAIFEDYTSEGTGLGLSLTKMILHENKGWVEVRSFANGVPVFYDTSWDYALHDHLRIRSKETEFNLIIPKRPV